MPRPNHTLALAALVASVLPAAPANASTLAAVDFDPARPVVSVGLANASVDMSLGNAWQVGATGLLYGGWDMGVRATYREAGGPDQASWGWTVAAGYDLPPAFATASSPYAWFEPAVTVAYPLGRGLTLRATLGPLLTVQRGVDTYSEPGYQHDVLEPFVVLWPNLELGYRLNATNELTFLGGGIIGWRGTF